MKKLVVDPDRKPHFVKVLHEEDETRMRIPEAFYPRISRESQSSKRAVVQGPSEAYWVINVVKTQNGIYLDKGWEIFVRENGLQMYDILVFRYDGSMQFFVKVFNMRGVPREECFTHVCSSPLPEVRIRCGSSSGYQREDSPLSLEIKRGGRPPRVVAIQAARKLAARANEIECRFSSRYPFFRIIIQKAYLTHNYLPIPSTIKRDYFSDDLTHVVVNDSDGRSWKIRLFRVKGDIRLSKNVSKFVKKKHGMNLKIGDVCIFEIIKKRSYRLVLQVHVFCRVPVPDDDSDRRVPVPDDDSDGDSDDDSDE